MNNCRLLLLFWIKLLEDGNKEPSAGNLSCFRYSQKRGKLECANPSPVNYASFQAPPAEFLASRKAAAGVSDCLRKSSLAKSSGSLDKGRWIAHVGDRTFFFFLDESSRVERWRFKKIFLGGVRKWKYLLWWGFLGRRFFRFKFI